MFMFFLGIVFGSIGGILLMAIFVSGAKQRIAYEKKGRMLIRPA